MALFQSAFTGKQVEQAVTNALGLDITINPAWPAAVACCISSNALDTDGGAWKKRCSGKSWYNEGRPSGRYLGIHASETAARAAGGTTGDWYARTTTVAFYQLSAISGETQIYRAGSKEFPAEVAVVAWGSVVVLFDLTQSGCPMWMVFRADVVISANMDLPQALPPMNINHGLFTSCGIVNGILVVGSVGYTLTSASTRPNVLCVVDFGGDSARHYNNGSERVWPLGIANRMSTTTWSLTNGLGIVNNVVNAVAITVLPTAPIDQSSGLPKPTIAVATGGGVSVIKDGGNVWDITHSSGAAYTLSYKISFNGEKLVFDLDQYSFGGRRLLSLPIPTADTVSSGMANAVLSSIAADAGTILNVSASEGTYFHGFSRDDITAAYGGTGTTKAIGLTLLKENPSVPARGLVAYLTSKYNSGWLPGDIRGAWLADSVAGTITSADTVADRSVKNKPLAVVGSITKAAVASGASTIGYGGFSATDHLNQSYNADFDFGTGDFCLIGWVDPTGATTCRCFERNHPTVFDSNKRITITVTNGSISAYTGVTALTGGFVSGWGQIAFLRKDGIRYLYANGVLIASGASTENLTFVDAAIRLGQGIQYPTGNPHKLALWRISATAPTAEQIKHIYETELRLFQANAQGILPGTSDSILSLGYDDVTETLHGHTSYGRFAFKNLLRVDSEATAVGTPTCVAAHDGKIVQGGSAAIKTYVPAFSLREELAQQAATGNPLGLETHWFVGSAGVTTFVMPFGWKPKFVYNAGQFQRDGAANAYTVTFDGFLYSIVFAVAPTAGNNIGVMAVRS